MFTANNTLWLVNHLVNLPSPTETFVRNYGPRLHHIALAVRDGETHGRENIECVVAKIAAGVEEEESMEMEAEVRGR